MSFTKPDSNPKFPALESDIINLWKEHNIFEKSVENRIGQQSWRFYDGPPFISGVPHYGHIKDFIIKDLVPRYWTMKGFYAPRVWGWDCHGLPIENKVEKKLGIKSKLEVEQLGIKKYIEECYSYTRSTSAEWPWYVERMGRWTDYDHAYRTMDQDYMETVWWVFKRLCDKGLVYKGWRSSLYSTDSATPISNFEIAMDNTYEDVVDDAITVKYKVKKDSKYEAVFKDYQTQIADKELFFLSWTTTPWTISANFALAVNATEIYSLIKTIKEDVDLTVSWTIKDLPFNYNKSQGVKIEKYLISKAGEEVDSAELITKAKMFKEDLTGLEITVEKHGKKFYFVAGETATELTQKEFQDFSKQALQPEPTMFTRYYYSLTGDDATGLDQTLEQKQLIAEINIFAGKDEGKQTVSVKFESPADYQEFAKELPTWFGEQVEVKGDLDKKPEEYEQFVILAQKLAETNLKKKYEVVGTFVGQDLMGVNYEQIFDFLPAGPNDFQVYVSDDVTVTDGTGVLHIAPAFGEEDFNLGLKYGISMTQNIDDAGKMIAATGKFAGIYLREANLLFVNELRKIGRLYNYAKFTHRLPFYRYENPLIYRAQDSWFVDIQKLKPNLFSQNENINWVPEHLKEGRFKKGIETAPDWSISRNRFWATPMPVWVEADEVNPDKPKLNYDNANTIFIGSRFELRELAVDPITRVLFTTTDSVEVEQQQVTDLLQDTELKIKHNESLSKIVLLQTASDQTESLVDLSKKLQVVLAKLSVTEEKVNFQPELQKLLEEFVKQDQGVSKTEMPAEFAGLVADFKVEFDKFLTSIKGDNIVVVIPNALIGLLKYVYEGKNIVESLRSLNKGVSSYTMFFKDTDLLDIHRPFIDGIKLKHPKTGKILVRISEVLDVWLDSGSMPFAQLHYPFENTKTFEEGYPADFIVEYIAQTRAWFYVMHVLGVSVTDQNAFKNVVTTGVIFGTDGRKMSKTYGNYPDPRATLENFGAEAMRWYFTNSRLLAGEDINFAEKALKDQIRLYLLPIWNIYTFFTTYANLHNWKPTSELLSNRFNPDKTVKSESETFWYKVPFAERENKLDIWIVALLQKVTHEIRVEMDAYNIPGAATLLSNFVESLSKWYIRRSRDRFAKGDSQAFETLYYVIVEFIKLTAPFTPFITEHIYQEMVSKQLTDQPESIHLTDYPEADMDFIEKAEKNLLQMEAVKEIVALGQSIRTQNSLKVRQPLATIKIKLLADPSKDQQIEDWMRELILDELNIKKLEETHTETEDAAGWVSQKSANIELWLSIDTNITPELKAEGNYRDLVRLIQDRRKKMGLNLQDQIKLSVVAESDFIVSLKVHEGELMRAVNAASSNLDPKGDSVGMEQSQIGEIKLFLKLETV